MYITTSDSNEETNRCTALSLSLSLKARVVADRWMSTTLLRLRRKIFRRTFRACGRRRQKGLAYNSIQSTKVVSGIDQIRKGYLIRSGRNGKYIVQRPRTTLHIYWYGIYQPMATSLYEPRVLTIEPDAFYRYSMRVTDDLLVTPE